MLSPAKHKLLSKDFHYQYVLGQALGKGAFAVVFSAMKMPTSDGDDPLGDVVAVKVQRIAKTEHGKANTDKKHAKREAMIWKAIGIHPNCVGLAEVFMDNYFCYMVMEKCDRTLLQYLMRMPSFDERSLGALCGQMLSGVAHCHYVAIAHLDVKPDNFLVGGEDGQVVKLADFGISRLIPKQGKIKHRVGTAPYMCPEMIVEGQYDEMADTWACGVLAYVLLFGSFPYMPREKGAGSKGMMDAIAQGDPPLFCSDCWESLRSGPSATSPSDEAVSLLKQLLRRHPGERATAKEALHSPWISACMKGDHMRGTDLPSLRPMLAGAKKAGAFDLRRPDTEKYADDLLWQLQDKYDRSEPEPSRGIAPVGNSQTREMIGRSALPIAKRSDSSELGSRCSLPFDPFGLTKVPSSNSLPVCKLSHSSNTLLSPAQVDKDPPSSCSLPSMSSFWTSVGSRSTHHSSSSSLSIPSPCSSPRHRQTASLEEKNCFSTASTTFPSFQRQTSPPSPTSPMSPFSPEAFGRQLSSSSSRRQDPSKWSLESIIDIDTKHENEMMSVVAAPSVVAAQ
jgi:serine/threonine protein kinase